jgi:hypothetical protein
MLFLLRLLVRSLGLLINSDFSNFDFFHDSPSAKQTSDIRRVEPNDIFHKMLCALTNPVKDPLVEALLTAVPPTRMDTA